MTLQKIFIANLKKARTEQGLSQMALSEKCDLSTNYISQIEMGRRIPSFDKIEKIAKALEIPSHELFVWENATQQKPQKPSAKDYLQKMPASVKKELITRLLATLKDDIPPTFDPQNY